METFLGETGLKETFQEDFEPRTECAYCGAQARIAFVVAEGKEKEYICHLYDNKHGEGGEFWPHDCVSVAIYFCTKCAKATAEYNQA
jgi:hypothetical protein